MLFLLSLNLNSASLARAWCGTCPNAGKMRLSLSRLHNDLHLIGVTCMKSLEPFGAIAKWDRCSDQRLDIDDASIHQVDALRVFAVATTGTMKRDFPCYD